MHTAAARHARGRQDSFGGADFLSRFLRSLGLQVEESEIELTPGLGCRIYTYARQTESAHWTFWSVTDDETALLDRKSTRLNSSHTVISYAVFCLKKKKKTPTRQSMMRACGHRVCARLDH